MKLFLFRFFLIILSIVMSLATIELSLRIFDIRPKIFSLRAEYVIPSANPTLGYELNPAEKDVNDYGLREQDNFTIQKKKDIYRIVVIGDSVTFGCCTKPLMSGFPFHLINLISSKNQNIEVINSGIVGYNTIQEAEFYKEKIKDLDPDFLILQVTLNDWMVKTFEYHDMMANLDQEDKSIAESFYDFGEKINKKFLSKSYIFQHIAYMYVSNNIKQLSENNLNEKKVLEDQNGEYVPEWKKSGIIENGMNNFRQYLDKKLEGRVLVVIFPDFKDNVQGYADELKSQHSYVAELASANGFDVLDLKDCYETDYLKNKKTFLIDDSNDTTHPNEYGHEVAAKCINDHLIKKYNFE